MSAQKYRLHCKQNLKSVSEIAITYLENQDQKINHLKEQLDFVTNLLTAEQKKAFAVWLYRDKE